MKRKIKLWSILLAMAFTGCQQQTDDSEYFNGKIMTIEDTIKEPIEVEMKELVLHEANYGLHSVHDSLLVFMNDKMPHHFYQLFNTNNGELIGTFCGKGQGPEEAIALGMIHQFIADGDEVKTLLYAINEDKLMLWNISRSLAENRTVIEKIIPYPSIGHLKKKGKNMYQKFYLREDSTLLVELSPNVVYLGDKAKLPHYQVRSLYTDELLDTLVVFKKSFETDDPMMTPEFFFHSNDIMKPDGTRIAQAMTYLPQLNIIDLKTKEVTGFRMEGCEGFSDLMKDSKTLCYGSTQADDKYIYTLFVDENALEEDIQANLIYVFDWNGHLVQKIRTDEDIQFISLDRKKNRIYTTHHSRDEVLYIDLEGIIE